RSWKAPWCSSSWLYSEPTTGARSSSRPWFCRTRWRPGSVPRSCSGSRIACAPGHNRFGLPAKRHEDREAAVSFLLQRSDVGEFRRRYRWLVLVVLVAFMVVIGRLVQLQLIEGDVHRAQARRNIVR